VCEGRELGGIAAGGEQERAIGQDGSNPEKTLSVTKPGLPVIPSGHENATSLCTPAYLSPSARKLTFTDPEKIRDLARRGEA
jgi:hypothetical protein